MTSDAFEKLLTSRQYVFKLHRGRVYYCSESVAKRAAIFPHKQLVSFGTSIGKMTKSGKFHLHITTLQMLSENAKNKMWLKEGSDMQFLYGNNPLRSGISKITDNVERNAGVVIYSNSDVALGFGVSAKSTLEFRTTDPLTVACYRQGDVGEYLRSEETI